MSDYVEKAIACAREIKNRDVKSWYYKNGRMRYTAGDDKRDFAVPYCFFVVVKNALLLWTMEANKGKPINTPDAKQDAILTQTANYSSNSYQEAKNGH